MKKNKIFYFLFAVVIFSSCNKFENEETFSEDQSSQLMDASEGLLKVEYDITTFRDYDVDFKSLSDSDLATVNPGEEKQHIKMVLFDSGQLNITISVVDYEKKQNIKHNTLPDDSPHIFTTKIYGNVANFYDKNGNLLSKETMQIPNHMETVNKIKKLGDEFSAKDINKTIATMQGHQFIDNLSDFIKNAKQNGIQVSEQANNFVTLRMNFSKIDPLMDGSSVILIDKKSNKMVGLRNYDSNNKLVQSVLFAYNVGDVESLSAMKITQDFILPSNKSINMVTCSLIENLKFNLNK